MSLVDPADPPDQQVAKLTRMVEALMRRVERPAGPSGEAYAMFERSALLEAQVRERTDALERALDLLQESNARLSEATRQAERARADLAGAIEAVDQGFALFDETDRLALYNTRFCEALPDVAAALRPGLTFDRYVEIIAASPGLAVEPGRPRDDWRRKRLQQHRTSHALFEVELKEDRWLQVSEQRTDVGGTVVLHTDVTVLVRRERDERARQIDRQARMTRATLDHLAQGVCTFDHDGRLSGWNAQLEAMLQPLVVDDIAGMPLGRLLNSLDGTLAFPKPDDRKRLLAWALRSRRSGTLAFEMERRTMPQATYAVAARETPDRGFVVSFADVTAERRNAEQLSELASTLERRVDARTAALRDALEEAQRANASRTRFMAAASHDLLQPLSAAKLFVAALEDRVSPNNKALSGKAASALRAVEAIIEALLAISRLESGATQADVSDVALGPLLDGLVTEFGALAAERGLHLRHVPTTMRVRSNPVWLRRIVQNLVANAIRHTDGAEILVGVRRSAGHARIEVLDRGPGIAAADRAVIFREFHQLGPSRSGANGLGLGLTIVERACAMLDHGLALRSEPRRGSTFAVTVPAAAGHPLPEPRPSSATAPSPAPDLEALVVFLVENDEDVAAGIALTIEGWGADLIHAPNGEEALALLDELGIAPDAFLVDYRLGDGMCGLDLWAALQNRYDGVPGRIISADRDRGLPATCAAAGAPLLPKPIDRTMLRAFLVDAIPRTA